MSFLKKLAVQLLPRTILGWGKRRYYSYVVPRFWEADVEPIKCFVRPGDSAVDLGANIGWYSVVLARLVGESGKVYAVEPIPETFNLLSAVVKKLGLSNIELFNCAVSDRHGSAVMEIPRHDYGGSNFYMAKIIPGQSSNSALDSVEVPLRSLDELLPGSLPGRVTFVKCDVEGHKLAVLKGASKFFQLVKPAMMMEVSGGVEKQDAPDNEFFTIMNGYGYVPYWFDGKHLRKRVKGLWSVNYFFLQPVHLQKVSHLLVE